MMPAKKKETNNPKEEQVRGVHSLYRGGNRKVNALMKGINPLVITCMQIKAGACAPGGVSTSVL